MSILNLRLQCIDLMRQEMDTESEEIMSRYNSMNDIIKVAEKNHNLKENLKQSLNPILTLLNDNHNLVSSLSTAKCPYYEIQFAH
ncbi:hypothetical protein GLOIN_2v1780204 [Rhizophagus irregularis DAOM 181602=DAOM 197198]|uniref:Uncharacterized protein n=1 Tax=Rhizophagus irregularis (strain DAOM 181602 / DAOM 197198 / MUCL 43194) TaxID=747089 RepID=A0A2P4PN36_RHIID|nr:hypothetical protein GLOIN_2v1780204 [Rhizophagus irregularis DAOM 181602=DAOM 197198]POG66793.1 hypothetical protein GLOIN_2v1780204 [Rhizophagus irregularis DAOM 181602=DAOM 197198]|eukprot:XP_025173659.1 hypothetical protein GLOIN_2v1780204 [Rhizophagus irregularis DAOM 181602=DAOM 197198]